MSVRTAAMFATGVGAALAVDRARRSYSIVVVWGNSMAPTFRDGDRVLARRRLRALQRGDIVVFTVNGKDYVEPLRALYPALRVKRVVALEGEPAPLWLQKRLRATSGETVPARHVVVGGDAPGAEGSGQLGYIPHDRIEGIVVRRLYPRRC